VTEVKSTYEEFLELQAAAAKAKRVKSESEKKSKSLERRDGAKQVEEKPKFRKFSIFSKANEETSKTEDSFANRPGKKSRISFKLL
jgi:hypothetical protein